MKTLRFVSLICICLGCQLVLAEEQIIRSIVASPRPVNIMGREITFQTPPEDIFVVYTKQEIDAKRLQDAEIISGLREKIAKQEQNIKKLADVNDSLVKRLEEMEKRINEIKPE